MLCYLLHIWETLRKLALCISAVTGCVVLSLHLYYSELWTY